MAIADTEGQVYMEEKHTEPACERHRNVFDSL